MSEQKLKIAFVRRGYSPSGGAEAYLQRLGRGLVTRGIYPRLITTRDWPDDQWQFGKIKRIGASTPLGFADELEQLRARRKRVVMFSLERVWSCDIFRAGDGVHSLWLVRKAKKQSALSRFAQRFNRKHAEILRLEESLFRNARAEIVIVNSELVRNEITATYGYPAERIRLIRNGVPISNFCGKADERIEARKSIGLHAEQIAVLFVGTGWDRKGLRYAIDAVEALSDPRFVLLIAGRGPRRRFSSPAARFLGETRETKALYSAADIFIAPTLYDPFSNACLEALASGLPIITTRDNGFSEVIESGVNGTIVHHGSDVPALVTALRDWADFDRRQEAAPVNIELAAHYDIARNVEMTLELILHAASAASTVGKIRNT